jgi:hypothetical protein
MHVYRRNISKDQNNLEENFQEKPIKLNQITSI